jgi:hypothetical protein
VDGPGEPTPAKKDKGEEG